MQNVMQYNGFFSAAELYFYSEVEMSYFSDENLLPSYNLIACFKRQRNVLRNLRRLRHIRRSLSTESATTLVHIFVTSQIDYCNVVFV